MKNVFFSLASMLIGSFAFASNGNSLSKTVTTKDYNEFLEYKNNITTKYIIDLVSEKALDCLLKITFVFEDGTSETKYVLVKGASCKEILG